MAEEENAVEEKPAEEKAGEEKAPDINPYELAEEGWRQLDAAAEKINLAAKLLKKSEHSIDGYNIERALNKHKPDLMKEHLRGLQSHRKEIEK